MVENRVKNDIKQKINKKSQNIIDSASDVNEQEQSSTSAPSSSSVKVTNGAPGREVDSPFVFAGGTGTFEDPYLIQTADQLNAVRKGLDNHYKLIADIDLSDWANWIPIGSDASYGCLRNSWNKEKGTGQFMGTFDGNGHVVSGMQIVICQETPYQTEKINAHLYGLFSSTLATSPTRHQIKNLGVVDFKIDIAVIGNEKFSGFDDFGRRPDGAPTPETYTADEINDYLGYVMQRDKMNSTSSFLCSGCD